MKDAKNDGDAALDALPGSAVQDRWLNDCTGKSFFVANIFDFGQTVVNFELSNRHPRMSTRVAWLLMSEVDVLWHASYEYLTFNSISTLVVLFMATSHALITVYRRQ